MPYASPSPPTSPLKQNVFPFPTSPRSETSRPPRHHMRSVSSDALPTNNSGFIYVQQPISSSNNKNHNGQSDWSSFSTESLNVTSPSSGITLSKPRRTKLFGFTPTSGEATFMAKEDVLQHDLEDELTPRPLTETTDSITTTSPPTLIPIPFPLRLQPFNNDSAPSSPSHIHEIKQSFARSNTPMLRKKSGELVRSSLKTGDSGSTGERQKTRSAPATPTFAKFVHFDTKLEHVKHFLAQQKPQAVSRSGSPVETETEDEPEAFPFPAMAGALAGLSLKLPNFPSPIDRDQDVYLESLDVSTEGKCLKGIVRVKNLAFEKWVAVRYTLDNWATVSEVSAEHHQTMSPQSDRFVFNIRLQDLLSKIEEKIMFIAIRYTVAGKEIWDSNSGLNYQVGFTKTAPSTSSTESTPIATKRSSWSSINAGQDKKMAELRRELDRLVSDDMDTPSSPLRSAPAFSEATGPFSTRYDFGTSLKMYTSQAPNISPPKSRSKVLPSIVNTIPHSTTSAPYQPNSDQSSYPLPIAPSLYSGYESYTLPSHEVSHSRYHTYPIASSSLNTSPQTSYSPLLPPSFRDHRRKESPFASPSTSPPQSSMMNDNYSPATSTSTSSTYSPDSEAPTSLGSSPPSTGQDDDSSRSEFSSFLDRVSFFALLSMNYVSLIIITLTFK